MVGTEYRYAMHLHFVLDFLEQLHNISFAVPSSVKTLVHMKVTALCNPYCSLLILVGVIPLRRYS